MSDSKDAVDWVHVFVPAGTSLRARVSLYEEWRASVYRDGAWGLPYRPSSPHYRLIVVGSTEHVRATRDYAGPYLRSLAGDIQ